MNLKELLGDAFKEGMTYTDVETALQGMKLADLSTGNYVDKNKYQTDINKLNQTIADKNNQLQSKLSDDEKKANEDQANRDLIEQLQNQIKEQGIENNKSNALATVAEATTLMGIKSDDKEFTSFIDIVSKSTKEDAKTLSTYFNKIMKSAYEKGKTDATKNALGDMGKQKGSGSGSAKDIGAYGTELAKRTSAQNTFSYFGKYNK